MTIQIIATIFIGFILGKTTRRFVSKEISGRLFGFWLLFWLIALVLFWIPDLSQRVADVLEVGRGVDAIVYISIVVLFYALFRVFNRFERMETQLTKLVREISIIEAKKKDAGDK